MATVVVRRPLRRPAPEMPAGELLLDAPPEIPPPPGRQWAQALMALPMVLMMTAMVLMFSGGVGGSGLGALRYVVFGLFGVSMLIMIGIGFLNGGGPSKREMGNARRLYLRALAQHRVRVRRTARRQRTALDYLHPDPAVLWSVAASYRLWERRRGDADFGVARIGTGRQSLATALVAPDTKPMEQLEPLSALALRRFITTHSAVADLPLAMAVNGFSRVHVRGGEAAVGLVRAVLGQLATLHAPDDLRIAVCASPQRRPAWEWLKWLPHALHPDRADALGPIRLVAPTIPMLEAVLDDLLGNRPRFDPEEGGTRVAGPHLVVVLDGGAVAGSDHLVAGSGVEGATVVDLTTVPPRAPDRCTVVLDVAADGALSSSTADGEVELGRADDLPVAAAEALARQLAPLRLTEGARGEQPLATELGLEELLDLGDPYAFDPQDTWVQRPNRDKLRVRFGIRPDGTPIELDLKESAQDGMGPHGLLIGATGSGKSELLRTLVLALAITHPPNSLNFALIDFKGGATFTRLDRLPHTSAVITNLADELPLVDRMADAITGELVRRQELLRAAGTFSSLRDYDKARASGAPLVEVPTLVVVIDEFSELLSARPDFIDIFVQIGRVGRSLGVHLLLASQRLEEGRLRGLDTHLSYRIGLRTFSDMDSRTVLGVPDAFSLPRAPGHGFLRYGDEPMARFRSAYVSGVHTPAGAAAPTGRAEPIGLAEYTTAYVTPAAAAEPEEAGERAEDAVGESLLDILVDRFAGRGSPAHQVWLPPLDDPPTLDDLLGPLAVDPGRGLCPVDRAGHGALKAVVGVVDKPLDQRRDPLVLDLAGGAGHVAVVGGPRSGKSTALRTLIAALALTHTPAEAQFYCLDFGGGALAALRGLPHVGGVAGRTNPGAVRRAVAEVAAVLAERERRFAQLDVDGMAGYRALRAAGRVADDQHGDVFLVVDGWSTLRKDFEDLEDVITTLATRGLNYGVHLVVTCARWFDLRTHLRDLFGSKVELRLGDPIDTAIDRKEALRVPEGAPGRCLAATRHQALTALPRVDGRATSDDLVAGVTDLVARVAAGWGGPSAPEVRLLPERLPHLALPPTDDPGHLRIAVGIAESDLAPVRLDFDADAHLLLLGDVDSGKTSFLRLLARRITASYPPRRAKVVVVDHRRGLLGAVGGEHLLGFGSDPITTRALMVDAAAGLRERLPGPDVTPEQLRARDWWRGPELFVLVDDVDLVMTSADNPLDPLLELLPHGRDIGLHVVVTRRTGGAGRALFGQFLSRLRDVGATGVLLSGDKEEGPLLGGLKAGPLPPGRGRVVSRRGEPTLVQLAHLPPEG
ncbi:type VII secretion protein EccCa [Actinokineospora bangkokensis]|uniref:Type VII secretion protein EccC n=1 Tax=Actinokineospora bangkokensis TaxID=1193682 RepID=A0A1Q9LTC8_9PSEU|nr:type VII secretion protein EccCa [Actinokineospora bangkokensis]OLR95297.1 type VII secretion protein EccC [Actinokineospora bangkokensis]